MAVCGDGIFGMNEPYGTTRLPPRDDSSATFIPSPWYIHRDSRVSAIGDHYLLITRPADTTIKTYYDRNVHVQRSLGRARSGARYRSSEFLSRHLIRLIAAGLTIIGQRALCERSVRFDAISSSGGLTEARFVIVSRRGRTLIVLARASSRIVRFQRGTNVNASRDPA